MWVYEIENGDFKVYVGEDKFENEKLIEWGWPEDVWFHVDRFSSAHVYCRCPTGKGIDDIPEELLNVCAQITKHNSIEGSKKPAVDIIYTPWENLRKDVSSMDVGTIGFHDTKKTRMMKNVTNDRAAVKKLESNRRQETPNFRQERLARDKEEVKRKNHEAKQAALLAKKKEREEREAYNLKHYTDLKVDPKSIQNQPKAHTVEECRELEDDFM